MNRRGAETQRNGRGHNRRLKSRALRPTDRRAGACLLPGVWAGRGCLPTRLCLRLLAGIVVILTLGTIVACAGEPSGRPEPAAPFANATPQPPSKSGLVKPTFVWTDFYGSVSVQGRAAPAGTIVEARTSDGLILGQFVVVDAGRYGILAAYGDDVTTPEKDGALAGEKLLFFVNGQPAQTLGPDEPVWQARELKQVNLSVP